MEARMAQHMSQFTIALPTDLRAFVERLADADGRTLSDGLIRVWITEAAKRAGYTNGSNGPSGRVLVPKGEPIETTRARLQELIAERDRLEGAERKLREHFPLESEERLRVVRSDIDSLIPLIQMADRMGR
jgi:hypothetical protein